MILRPHFCILFLLPTENGNSGNIKALTTVLSSGTWYQSDNEVWNIISIFQNIQ